MRVEIDNDQTIDAAFGHDARISDADDGETGNDEAAGWRRGLLLSRRSGVDLLPNDA